MRTIFGTSLADLAGFGLVEAAAADAFVRAVEVAALGGAVLPGGPFPEGPFRHAVAAAIDAIQARGDLLQRFLSLGPYEGDGPIPPDLCGKRLTDAECNRAIALIHSHAINSFKGQLAEVYALKSFATLIDHLKREDRLPRSARSFAGDSAMPLRGKKGVAKGADLHVLDESSQQPELLMVGEVKSYPTSARRLEPQLESHVARAFRGLRVSDGDGATRVVLPTRPANGVTFLSASPSGWRLSRTFEILEEDGQTLLHSAATPPVPDDEVVQLSHTHWHVTLGVSQEFLASQAFGLTYWYMEQLGKALFSNGDMLPWPEMTPENAGANAAKQSLYYAIRRCTDARAEQRAIALYNAYGFGYSLGTSFSDAAGRRQMLWLEQLREIAASGKTKDGFRFSK